MQESAPKRFLNESIFWVPCTWISQKRWSTNPWLHTVYYTYVYPAWLFFLTTLLLNHIEKPQGNIKMFYFLVFCHNFKTVQSPTCNDPLADHNEKLNLLLWKKLTFQNKLSILHQMLHPTLLVCYSSYAKQHLTGKNKTTIYGSNGVSQYCTHNKIVAMENIGTTFKILGFSEVYSTNIQ